ncbi:hypothetical protein GBF38_020970 [Nibea albiflora]|uniref:Uncharacterized protein n=1 Tax=Nibea albiflora TaxID=240163 RepID=A0ACB7FFL8_NIBAL|nr:hypothetical protein GBF38_020970 [Nibea albiflora]
MWTRTRASRFGSDEPTYPVRNPNPTSVHVHSIGPDNPGKTVTSSPQTGGSKQAQTSQRAPSSLDRSHHTVTSRRRTLENSDKHRHFGVSPRSWMEVKLIPGIP